MRVLIIGGTRFIGPHVARHLHQNGHQVTLFHRGQTAGDLPTEIEHIYGDRLNLPDSRDRFKQLGPDVVLDMVPLQVEEARVVVETFMGIAGRLVAVSSGDVYRAYGVLHGSEDAPIDNTPLTEDSPLRTQLYPYRGQGRTTPGAQNESLDDYDKIPVEEAVLGEYGLPGTICRLGMVYGPHDSQHRLFNYLKRMDDGRKSIILDEVSADFRASRIYVENAGVAIAQAVMSDEASGRVYNVAEPEAYTEQEWIRKVGGAAGWDGDVVVLPTDAMPPEMLPASNLAQHLVLDTTRIREELGYSETISEEDALRRTIEWQRANPPAEVDPARFDYDLEDRILEQAR